MGNKPKNCLCSKNLDLCGKAVQFSCLMLSKTKNYLQQPQTKRQVYRGGTLVKFVGDAVSWQSKYPVCCSYHRHSNLQLLLSIQQVLVRASGLVSAKPLQRQEIFQLSLTDLKSCPLAFFLFKSYRVLEIPSLGCSTLINTALPLQASFFLAIKGEPEIFGYICCLN